MRTLSLFLPSAVAALALGLATAVVADCQLESKVEIGDALLEADLQGETPPFLVDSTELQGSYWYCLADRGDIKCKGEDESDIESATVCGGVVTSGAGTWVFYLSQDDSALGNCNPSEALPEHIFLVKIDSTQVGGRCPIGILGVGGIKKYENTINPVDDPLN